MPSIIGGGTSVPELKVRQDRQFEERFFEAADFDVSRPLPVFENTLIE